MAKVVTIVCDHCDSETDVQPVEVRIQGKRHTADLCPEAVAILKEWVKPARVKIQTRKPTRTVHPLDDEGNPVID